MNNVKVRNSSGSRSGSNFRVCVKPSDLANTLATLVNSLGLMVDSNEALSDADIQGIFASARSARILAREATVLSRFDRAVADSEYGSVFSDSDFNYGRWVNG